MGSIDEKAEEKLDNLIQQTETLDAEPTGGASAPAPPPSPPPKPRITLDSFRGQKKDHKTQCNICERYYVDLEEHLTRGKSGCSKVVKSLGYGEDAEGSLTLEAAIAPYFGLMVCTAILDLLGDWLKPEYRDMPEEWKEKTSAAIQTIAEEQFGDMVRSPYIILLVCLCEFTVINRDGIRRKYKSKKLPDDSALPDGFKGGSPTVGFRGDSGDRENPNGKGTG